MGQLDSYVPPVVIEYEVHSIIYEVLLSKMFNLNQIKLLILTSRMEIYEIESQVKWHHKDTDKPRI